MRRNFIYLLLILTLLLPIISYVRAAEKPAYVGINENEELIWKTTFDTGPYEDYLEDWGLSDAEIELIMEDNALFDGQTDKDVKGWKMVIIEIKDEKEYDLEDDYPDLDEDEYKGVPYLYNLYTTEDFEAKDWEEEDRNERSVIYKADTDVYAQFIIASGPPSGLNWGMGSYFPVVSKNVNWGGAIGDADDEFEDDYEDAGASKPKETTFFFFEQEVDGVKTFYDRGEELGNDDIGDFESISIYTDNGILKYYEWNYNGDPIYKLELEENWFIANWWIIAIVAGVAIIIVIIIYIKKR